VRKMVIGGVVVFAAFLIFAILGINYIGDVDELVTSNNERRFPKVV